MKVEVAHALPPLVSDIGHHPVAPLRETLLAGYPSTRLEKSVGQPGILVVKGVEGFHMAPGNHQEVHRSLGVKVAEGDHRLRFEDPVRGHLAFDDPAKYTIHSHHSLIVELLGIRGVPGRLQLSDLAMYEPIRRGYGEPRSRIGDPRFGGSSPPFTNSKEARMIPNPDDLAEVAHHHPAPAITLEEAQSLLASDIWQEAETEDDGTTPDSRWDPQLRLLTPQTRRWANLGPREWILACGGTGGPVSPRSILGRLRESLRRLGEELEPGSTLQLARWELLLREERKVRRTLRRRLRRVGLRAGR